MFESIDIQPLTQENFNKFGKIIKFSNNPEDERFEVVIKEQHDPWRIAVFRVKIRETLRLECHPKSMESFEPISGMGILLCALPESPDKVHAFPLDKPVCLYKGVWHEVITLSSESIYKITENAEVESEFYNFSNPIKCNVSNVF